jgi:hypothetical protein
MTVGHPRQIFSLLFFSPFLILFPYHFYIYILCCCFFIFFFIIIISICLIHFLFFLFHQGVKVILCLTTRVQIKELFINCSSLYCCYIYQSLYGIQKIMVQQKIECLQWMMVSTLG